MIYAPDALILAPLSGFSDAPYRRSARSCGCRYAFTEMVDASSLVFAFDRSKELLFRGMEEIRKLTVKGAVACGDVIVSDFLGTGVDLIASGSSGAL